MSTPITKKHGGMDAKLTQACNGRLDLHRLYDGIEENEMQTIVKDPRDIEIQSVLIKIHTEKPTPHCQEYRQINNLLESLDKQMAQKTKKSQAKMMKDNLQAFNQDDQKNLNEDQYMQ